MVQGQPGESITDHLIIDTTREVAGSLTAGATVKNGGHLIVRGSLDGPLYVETGGTVTVYGSTTSDAHLLGGLVLVAGVFEGRVIERTRGYLGLAVGSIYHGRLLRSDSSLEDPSVDQTSDITVSPDTYRFLLNDGTFTTIEVAADES